MLEFPQLNEEFVLTLLKKYIERCKFKHTLAFM
jgi:hypothetical protein